MPGIIRSNSAEVSQRRPMLGFTVRTGGHPFFEVAVATAPDLFRPEARSRRTPQTFWSSRAGGPLAAERGEAVYLVPAEVLSRFAGQPRLYYAVATFADAGRGNPAVQLPAPEVAPYVTVTPDFSGRPARALAGAGAGARWSGGSGYGAGEPASGASLEWAGDAARPGVEASTPAPAQNVGTNGNGAGHHGNGSNGNGSNGNGSNGNDASSGNGAAPAASAALAYDDGFDPGLWSQPLQAEAPPQRVAVPFIAPRGLEAEEAEAEAEEGPGIEGPIPDDESFASGQAWAGALTGPAPEYPRASRFVPAADGNFGPQHHRRRVRRVVIHITDGGPRIGGTISHFRNPQARVSAHYVVGQDGEVVQMVRNNDMAYHANGANGNSIGIEHVANRRGLMPTEAEYCASAALVRWLCAQYGLPLDRAHIMGHAEADRGTRHPSCPSAAWDWDHYMALVTAVPGSLPCEGGPATGQGYGYQAAYARPYSGGGGGGGQAEAVADIPLDPGAGGRSIGADALETGDIIVSTTAEFISGGIRVVTGQPVSHAMLYVGDGMVVEAVGSGVELHTLEQAVGSATVAVAFRYPGLTHDQGLRVRDYVGRQLGRAYNYWGIVRQARFRMASSVCDLFSGERREACRTRLARVYLGSGDNQTFFCSQLVLAAYRDAGVPLSAGDPSWASPGDIPELHLATNLAYVGHLKAPPLAVTRALAVFDVPAAGALSGGGTSVDFTWDDVQLIGQRSTLSCWAAAAAMVVGWRDRVSIDPEEVARGAGYWAQYANNMVLPYRDTEPFANGWRLVKEPPQSYTIQAFVDLLRHNGPLWVGAITPMDHVFVVTGIQSGGAPDGSDTIVRIMDPWDRLPGTRGHPGGYTSAPSGNGSRYQLTWADFVRMYEQGITWERDGTVNLQIIHSGGTGGRAPSTAPQSGYTFALGAGPARALSGGVDFDWDDLELMGQPNDLSCWATAASMLLNWRAQATTATPRELAHSIGMDHEYVNGCPPPRRRDVAQALGLQTQPPQSFSIDAFIGLLRDHGPLYVAAKTPMKHVVVVTGIISDGNPDGSGTRVRIADPWERAPGIAGLPNNYRPTPGGGSRYTLSWADFVRMYEDRVSTGPDGSVNVQILHHADTGGRRPSSGSRHVYSQGLALASALALHSFSGEQMETVRREFVNNAAAGAGRMNCITIVNAAMRSLYGGRITGGLGSTIHDTMGALQRYGLADAAEVFEFLDASGRLTRGVVRPDRLQRSIEGWILAQAEANQASGRYMFGLSVMDGYHSVILGLEFSGTGSPDTHLYWADQVLGGWHEVTGGLDALVTSKTQGWWDPLPAGRKARTRATVWPLVP